MKNSFLQAATKAGTSGTTWLQEQEMLSAVKTPLQQGNKQLYASQRASVAKQVLKNKKTLKTFTDYINKYTSITGTASDVSDIDKFVKYATTTSGIVKLKYASGSTKEFKIPLDKKTAQRAYVQYWIDKMIVEHNKRIEQADKLSKKHYGIDYEAPRLDVSKPVIKNGRATYEQVNIEDIYKVIDVNVEKTYIRSREQTYRLPGRVSDENKKLILDTKKHKLNELKNTKLLFINNLLYAARKAGWTDVVDELEKMINNNDLKAVYDAYNEADVDIIFEYDEPTSDMTSAQQKLLTSLKKYQK